MAARNHLEDLVEYRPLYRSNPQTADENAILENATELLEDLMLLECETCHYCSDFSKHSCELCGEQLAGARHAIAQIERPSHDIVDAIVVTLIFDPLYFEACVDCLMFVANGDLPDG